MRSFLPCALALAAFLSACSDAPPSPDATEPGESAAVGILKSRGHEVLLHSTPEGSRYSLRGEDGAIVARELTREELAEAFPEIHEELKSLWAGNEAGIVPQSPATVPAR